MPKVVSEFLGRLFLALADPAGVDNDVVVMRDAIDPDGTEGKVLELHLDLHWLPHAGWGALFLLHHAVSFDETG